MTKEQLEQAKPILFNTDMVRAILEGRKMVTRRICKDGNDYTVPDMSFYDADKRTYAVHNYSDKEHTEKLSLAERACPICPGDILYVRETWSKSPFTNYYVYRADGDGELFKQSYDSEIMDDTVWKWHPSIHMPKEAARIWLKVTDVRVERLKQMDCYDALKEGIDPRLCVNLKHTVVKFSKLWNSTIKKADLPLYGWEANPWVWVIEFKRMIPED